MILENQQIICFGFAEWDNPYKTNQHHVMQRFSAHNDVLFIESLGLRQPAVQKKDILRMARRVIKWLRGVRRDGERMHVFAPLVIPLHRFALVRAFNRWFLSLQLRGVVRALKFRRPILWSYVPNAVEYIGFFDEKISVYHCVDELSANPRIPRETVQDMERAFLKKVDVVFTTAQNLYESKKPFNPRTFYLPNVADFDHFHTAFEELLPDRAPQKNATIGFIGAISDYKLDFALLDYVAGRHPEWTFVLIGATGEGEKAADLSMLTKHANITMPGGKPYQELPAYLRSFDVCLLPNRINEYTANMFPMKFFEYLAAGKPVVSTALSALKEFGAYCYLSSSHEEFEKNIITALRENTPALQKARVDCARQYTWEKRLDDMSRIITETIAEKSRITGSAVHAG